LVVDGMNVVGSRADGWWRDRPAARRRLVRALANLVESGEDVTVVFDGNPEGGEVDEATASGVRALFAPGGPDAADQVIVKIVEATGSRSAMTVVTSDEILARRSRELGARVEGAGTFRKRLGP
jgi:RNA methyltransferase, TrmH family